MHLSTSATALQNRAARVVLTARASHSFACAPFPLVSIFKDEEAHRIVSRACGLDKEKEHQTNGHRHR
jgi:hypothetical protein